MAQCADYGSWLLQERFSPLKAGTMATEDSHPPLLRKHSQLAHINVTRCPDATALLLSSPLPPELVVALKSCSSSSLTPATSSASSAAALLRSSSSETDVQLQQHPASPHKTVFHAESAGISGHRVVKVPLTRTCSEGLHVTYRSSGSSKPRRKLESEDSSYDSDYECSTESPSKLALGALTNSMGNITPTSATPSEHDDVSRTVSDTLGQEFSEYVSLNQLQSQIPVLDLSEEPSKEDSDDDEEEYEEEEEGESLAGPDPSYTSKVEFALKLGYTEQQVRAVLNKLGSQPSQNELLAELIRIASLAPAAHAPNSPATLSEQRLLVAEEGDSKPTREDGTLRHIVIDGSNVAMSHGNKERFSCRGIQICVDWFRARGHKDITVFVPKWRKEASRPEAPISDQEVLLELEKCGILVFTPSRLVGGRRLVCYDDRYILRLALEVDGVVVSNDNYRDLSAENPDFRRLVQDRILMYSFVNDRFMPPEDPLGRNGPSLDQFLNKKSSLISCCNPHHPPCPYGKKCTYGNKCKYFHPERGSQPQKSVTERLAEQSQKHMQELKLRSSAHARVVDDHKKSLSVPLTQQESGGNKSKTPLTRTRSVAAQQAPPPPIYADLTPPMAKSKSVENMAMAARLSPLKSLPNHTNQQPLLSMWLESSSSHGNHNVATSSDHGHSAVNPRLSDPPPQEPNAHRKVQRQLTLNPSYDPRLYRYHHPLHYCNDYSAVAPPPYPPPASIPPPLSHPNRFEHAHVTRNASAPDAFWSADRGSGNQPTGVAYLPRFAPAVPPIQRLNSTSDTQLNRYCGGSSSGSTSSMASDVFQADWNTAAPWQQQQQQACRTSSVPLGPPPPPSYVDSRAKLYYHLAAIFPPEEVRQALLMFPDECNPQKICAAILNLFPTKTV